jgi:hypothetical protein
MMTSIESTAVKADQIEGHGICAPLLTRRRTRHPPALRAADIGPDLAVSRDHRRGLQRAEG